MAVPGIRPLAVSIKAAGYSTTDHIGVLIGTDDFHLAFGAQLREDLRFRVDQCFGQRVEKQTRLWDWVDADSNMGVLNGAPRPGGRKEFKNGVFYRRPGWLTSKQTCATGSLLSVLARPTAVATPAAFEGYKASLQGGDGGSGRRTAFCR